MVNGGINARYAPSGHLVFPRSGILFAAPFDPGRLAVTGPEVPVIQDIALGTANTLGTARYAFSDSGLLVYLGGGERPPDRTLEWADRQGGRQASNLPPPPTPVRRDQPFTRWPAGGGDYCRERPGFPVGRG